MRVNYVKNLKTNNMKKHLKHFSIGFLIGIIIFYIEYSIVISNWNILNWKQQGLIYYGLSVSLFAGILYAMINRKIKNE